eukprot:ANDGO_05787.mRNA.1 hypothetical protein
MLRERDQQLSLLRSRGSNEEELSRVRLDIEAKNTKLSQHEAEISRLKGLLKRQEETSEDLEQQLTILRSRTASDDELTRARSELKSKSSLAAQLETECARLRESLRKEITTVQDLEQQLALLRARSVDEEELTKLRSEIRSKNAALLQLESDSLRTKELLKSENSSLKDAVQRKDDELRAAVDQIASTRANLSEMERQARASSDLNSKNVTLQSENARLKDLLEKKDRVQSPATQESQVRPSRTEPQRSNFFPSAEEDASLYDTVDLRLDETHDRIKSAPDSVFRLGECERIDQAKKFLQSYKSDLKKRQVVLKSQQAAFASQFEQSSGGDRDVIDHLRKLLEVQTKRFNDDVKQFESCLRWIRLREERLRLMESSHNHFAPSPSPASPLVPENDSPGGESERRLLSIEKELRSLGDKMQIFLSAALSRDGAHPAALQLPFVTSASPPQKPLSAARRKRSSRSYKPHSEDLDETAVEAMAPEWQAYVKKMTNPTYGPVSRRTLHSLRDFQTQLLLWANENTVSDQVLQEHSKWLRSLRRQVSTMKKYT